MEAHQQQLRFPNTHGGRRVGAGRPKGSRTSTRITHTRRPRVSEHRPHHVTVRVTRGTWNLRAQRCFRPIAEAFSAVRQRADFRLVHFSVQHNHLHLIVEANGRRAMSNALRALLARIARSLNQVMSGRGARFDDRYHEHILRTPTEVRNALHYVLGNRGVHLSRWGKPTAAVDDALSSLVVCEPTKRPRSWLLREGWTRAEPPS